VGRISSVEERMEVVKRNIEFEATPQQFQDKYQPLQEELKKRIAQARELLPKVEMSDKLLEVVCKASLDLKVDGMRPDIVISKAAATLAAFENRAKATLNDVLVASELALSHRTREGGFLEPATPDEIKQVFTTRAKEIGYMEDTGSPPPDTKEKGKAKGRGLFWERGEASEKEEEKLKKHEDARARLSQIFFAFNRLFGSPVFGLVKRLRKGLKKAPVVDGALKDGKFKSNETTELEKKEIKKGMKALPTVGSDSKPPESAKDLSLLTTKAPVPTVSSALGLPQLAEGVSVFAKLKEKFLASFKSTPKIKSSVKKARSHVGKRAETVTALHRGRPYGWRFPLGAPRDVHLPATIRAAARKQKEREKTLGLALRISLEDVREKLRLYKAPMTLIFVLDLSGSMLMNLEALKTAILNSHKEAYRSRDRVGIVAVKDTGAVVVQHPITNLRVVANKLAGLKVSGFTPLAAGMLKAREVLKEEKRRNKSTIPVMIIMTDGSANVPLTRSLETGEVRQFKTIDIAVRKYEDWAIQDVMAVSKIIKKEGIHTVAVNTNPHLYGRETYGFFVTKTIASITNGALHEVGRLASEGEMVEKVATSLGEDRRLIAHKATVSLRSAD
jgi:magnesium chelatase subunit D